MELAERSTSFAVGRDEQTLVAAARAGNDRAFEQLYAQYRDRVSGFIYSKVRDHGRAEDISQEVFMAALRQLRASDQAIAFKPWIFAIAKNACIDEFRRSSRGREVSVETDDDFPTGGAGTLSLVPTPPAAVEGKQRLQDLRGAFGGLSENHHQLLVMRELEGRSYDEIGERLGMTKQMVESGLFRARRKLSEEYEELASGRRCEQVQAVIETGNARTLHALGIKQRRRVSRHLSHCEPCRHHARMAGVDETLLKPRSIGAKIAALFPFGGLWRWPWRSGRGGRGGSGAAKAHAASGHLAASAAGAAQAAGTAGSSITLGQAAVAAAALAIAGAGGGVALAHHGPAAHPARAATTHVHRASAHSGAGTAASAVTGTTAVGGTGSHQSAAGRVRSAATTAGRPGTSAIPGAKATATGSQPARQTRQDAPRKSASAGTPAGGTSTSGNPASGTGSPASGATNPVSTAPSPVSGLTSGSPVSTTSAKTVVAKTVGGVTAPVKKVVETVGSLPPVKHVLSTVTPSLPTPTVPTGSGSTSSGTGSGAAPTTSPIQDPVGTIKKIVAGL